MYTSHYLQPIREQYSYYARRLLQDLGLSDLTGPLRSQVLVSVEQYLSQILTNTILQHADQTTLIGVNDMAENGRTDDEVTAYLIASIPDIDKKIAQAMADSYAKLLEQSRVFSQAIADQTRGPQDTPIPDNTVPDLP